MRERSRKGIGQTGERSPGRAAAWGGGPGPYGVLSCASCCHVFPLRPRTALSHAPSLDQITAREALISPTPTLIHARNARGEEGMDEGAMKGYDRDARWGDVIMRETWGPGEGRGKAINTNIITRK